MNHAPSDSGTAQALAHELFAHECFAFTGDGPKPHSRRCQDAAQRLEEWRGVAQQPLDRDTIATLTKQVLFYQEQLSDAEAEVARLNGITEKMLDAAARQPWQLITTAPLNQFVLVFCPEDGSRWIAKWQGLRWCGVDEHGLTREGHSLGDPEVVTGWAVSHWMPVPDGPAD
jgi:hypothetical protein